MGVYEKLRDKLFGVLSEAMRVGRERWYAAHSAGDWAKGEKYQKALDALSKLVDGLYGDGPIARTSALSAEDLGKVSWALSYEDFDNAQARKKGSFSVWAKAMAREGHLPADHPGIELAGALFGDIAVKTQAEYEIRLYEGKALQEMYAELDNGLSSCMTKGGGELVALWALNPDKVALAVAFRGGRPLARALLWRDISGQDEDGNMLRFSTLDRTYASEEGAREALKRWAYANGYAARSNDDYYEFSSGRWFELPDGTKVTKAQVYLKRERGTPWPYADSFRYLLGYSQTDCYLGTHNDDAVGELDRIGGDYTSLVDDEDEYVVCQGCRDAINPDDAYYPDDGSGPYCESCYEEYYTTCDICNREVASENVHRVDSDTLCRRCYERYVRACNHCGEDFYEEHLRRVEGDDGEIILLCEWCYEHREERKEEVEVEG